MTLPNWIPSWLASAVLHLAAFNLLALLTLPRSERPAAPFVVSISSSDPVDSLSDAFDAPAVLATSFAAPLAHEPASALEPAASTLLDDPLALSFTPKLLDDDVFQAARSAETYATSVPDDASHVATSQARFFGVDAAGDTIIYIVDSSRSMIGPRFESAKHELLYSIQQLRPTQKFYVYFFDGVAKPMALGDDHPFTPGPVQATRENQALLAAWVATVPNGAWTNPAASVANALRFHPDAIFILTDGDFTDRGETLRILARDNLDSRRRPKAKIHTIGLHSRAAEGTLKNIAQRHGGVYRHIPALR